MSFESKFPLNEHREFTFIFYCLSDLLKYIYIFNSCVHIYILDILYKFI